MTSIIPDIATPQALIDLHFEIWNETDPGHGQARFAEVYTLGFFVADPDGVAQGHASIAQLISKVHAMHAGFVFRPDPVTWNHGLGRVTWGYGPADNPDLIRGEDIFTIEDGKLTSAYVFLDPK